MQRQNRNTKNSSFSIHFLDAERRLQDIKKKSKGDIHIFQLKANEFDEKVRRQ